MFPSMRQSTAAIRTVIRAARDKTAAGLPRRRKDNMTVRGPRSFVNEETGGNFILIRFLLHAFLRLEKISFVQMGAALHSSSVQVAPSPLVFPVIPATPLSRR